MRGHRSTSSRAAISLRCRRCCRRSNALVADIEILRLHYAETLKAWRERFRSHREDIERIYEQRFIRMWEFYLAASEMSFREQNLMVMQIQLTKRQDIVPMTRDYIIHEENLSLLKSLFVPRFSFSSSTVHMAMAG